MQRRKFFFSRLSYWIIKVSAFYAYPWLYEMLQKIWMSTEILICRKDTTKVDLGWKIWIFSFLNFTKPIETFFYHNWTSILKWSVKAYNFHLRTHRYFMKFNRHCSIIAITHLMTTHIAKISASINAEKHVCSLVRNPIKLFPLLDIKFFTDFKVFSIYFLFLLADS